MLSGSMETKAFPAEFKVDFEGRSFTGYASTFGNVDLGGDRVHAGAFAKTIQERGNRVKVLWQHSRFDPIGKPVRLEEDLKGLITETKVSDTTLGRDVLTLMADGVVDQLSIGYDVVKFGYDGDVRDLLELRLIEYSPVTFAMNEEAVILGVKEQARRLAEHGLKAGRVLSKRNLGLVRDAYEALGSLLDAAGKPDDESTSEDDAADDKKAKEPVQATPEPLGEPFAGLMKEIRDLGGWSREQTLLRELQAFGRQLKTGEPN